MCRPGQPLPDDPRLEDIVRFFAKTVIGPAKDDCWFWSGSLDEWGYPTLKFANRRVYAHRFSFAIFGNELTPNMQIHHTCHHPPCVNPDHLRQISHSENAGIKSASGATRRDGNFWRRWVKETLAALGKAA